MVASGKRLHLRPRPLPLPYGVSFTLRKYPPCPALRPYVECYYLLRGATDRQSGSRELFLPDGAAEMVFHYGLTSSGDGADDPVRKVIGQLTRPLEVHVRGRGHSFGIWFRPAGLAYFTDLAASELTDTVVSTYALFPQAFVNALDRRLAGGRVSAAIRYLEAYLLRLLTQRTPTKRDYLVNALIDRYPYAVREQVTLAALAEEYGVSVRYLQVAFKRMCGLTPRQFVTIAQFSEAVATLHALGEKQLTEVAYACGYYDQAHFIRSFRRLSGRTPSAFLRSASPLAHLFLA